MIVRLSFVQLSLLVSQEEYKLLKELSPLSNPQVVASAYGSLMAPILKLFNSVLAQLLTLVKKALHKYNFLALSVYEGLLSLQPHWNDLLSRRGPDHAEDKNEFKDGMLALRALCLRSFPEFLADLKLGAMARGSDTGTKLMDFTVSVSVSVSLLRDSSQYLYVRRSNISRRFHVFKVPLNLPSMHLEMEIGRWERASKWARASRRTKQITQTLLNILFVSPPHFRLVLSS